MPLSPKAILSISVFSMLVSGTCSSRATDLLQIPSIFPEGSRWHRDIEKAAATARRQTDGRVNVRLYERSVFAEVPEIGIYSLPLAFADDAELARVRAQMDGVLIEILNRRGLVTLGLQHIGNGHIFSAQPSAGSPGSLDTFLAARLWIPNRTGGDTLGRFGIRSPVVLDYEKVRGAVREGTVDTLIVTPSTSLSRRFHTRISSVSREPIMRFVVPLVAHRSEFEKLSEGDRAVVRRVLGEAFASAAQTSLAKDAEALKLLGRRRSIEFFDLAGRDQWDAWAKSVGDRLVADRKLPASLVRQLRELAD